MKRSAVVAVLAFTCGCIASATPAFADKPSLLQMFAEWQYPESAWSGGQMSDGATVDATGRRTAPSIVCKAAMTTDDSVAEVVDYYRMKLAPAKTAEGQEGAPPNGSGRSVFFSDDSEGRPFAIHTVLVNDDGMATTLVISRGQDEAKTHIAWKHYRRFPH